MNWNHYPNHTHDTVRHLFWSNDIFDFDQFSKSILPHGNGRSYGDCCLNDQNILLSTKHLNHFIHFNQTNGQLTCESGVTLGEILSVVTLRGWFLPVLPGTQYVTVGGAIANDIHGKNHSTAGTFGQHVLQFELLRSDGVVYVCSPTENTALYHATIAGLGLTGIILRATIQLKPIKNPFLSVKLTKFDSFEAMFAQNHSCGNTEYNVAWIDPYNRRGHFLSAVHGEDTINIPSFTQRKRNLSIPFGHPMIFNSLTISVLNQFYFNPTKPTYSESIQHYQQFFFPLDNIANWNRIYGTAGFLQYQCVIPANCVEDFLKVIKQSSCKTTLMVMKNFGAITSPGLLSFPKEGTTLAIDFPYKGKKLLAFLDHLDAIVLDLGGRVNPAKDARMSAKAFHQYFPNWQVFQQSIDNKFSSSFLRRISL